MKEIMSYANTAGGQIKKNYRFLIAAGIVLEFLLFYSMYTREILHAVPAAFDQVGYMLQSYGLFEAWLNKEWDYILNFISGTPNGCLIQLAGMANLLIFGKSRFSLILLNFEALAITQVLCGYLIKKMTGSKIFTVLFAGFLFLINGTYFWAGGLSDYRLDFILFCLYTCWGCLYLAAYCMRRRKYYVFLAILSAVIVLCRPIAATYIGLAVVLFELADTILCKKRIIVFVKRVFGIGLSILLASGWYILILFDSLFNYYIVGHVISNEKNIRAAEQGVVDTLDNLLFYPRSILNNHLTRAYIILAAIVIFTAILLWVFRLVKKDKDISNAGKDRDASKIVLILCVIISPIIILTCDMSKSPIAGNVVTGSISLLVAYLCYYNYKNNKYLKKAVMVFTAFVICFGAIYYFRQMSQKQLNYGAAQEQQRSYTLMNGSIAEYVDKYNIDNLAIMVDRTDGFMNGGTVSLDVYEKTGRWISASDPIDSLVSVREASSIMNAFDEEILDEALRRADIIVVSPSGYSEVSMYPKDISYGQYRDKIFDYAQTNLERLSVASLNGRLIYVFGRDKVLIESGEGGVDG